MLLPIASIILVLGALVFGPATAEITSTTPSTSTAPAGTRFLAGQENPGLPTTSNAVIPDDAGETEAGGGGGGRLKGDNPGQQNPVEPASWGAIKALFG